LAVSERDAEVQRRNEKDVDSAINGSPGDGAEGRRTEWRCCRRLPKFVIRTKCDGDAERMLRRAPATLIFLEGPETMKS